MLKSIGLQLLPAQTQLQHQGRGIGEGMVMDVREATVNTPAELAGNTTSETLQKSALGCWRKLFTKRCLFPAISPKGCVRGSSWILGIAGYQSLQEPGVEEAACTIGASIGRAVHDPGEAVHAVEV